MPMIGLFARDVYDIFTTASSSHVRPRPFAPNDPGIAGPLATTESKHKYSKQH